MGLRWHLSGCAEGKQDAAQEHGKQYADADGADPRTRQVQRILP